MSIFHRLFPYLTPDPLASKIFSMFGFKPKKIALYHQALCHGSISKPKYGNNERLEFLGDSILNSIVSEYLYENLSNKNEGVLSDIRSKIVSRSSLNRIANKFKLQSLVQTNLKGEIPESIAGNAFEALIAAIYLDKGQLLCKKFIIDKIIVPNFSLSDLEKNISSYKKHFIQWAQNNNTSYTFKLLAEKGEPHNKSFHIGLFIEAECIEIASSQSKKKAEEAVSKKACISLNI